MKNKPSNNLLWFENYFHFLIVIPISFVYAAYSLNLADHIKTLEAAGF
jgi:hypothetical protein